MLTSADRVVGEPVHLLQLKEAQPGERIGGRRPGERDVHIRPLLLRELDPRLTDGMHAQVRGVEQLEQVGEQTPQQRIVLLVRELLGRELANRLEHPEAVGLPAADEALVHQRLQELDVGVCDPLGRFERPAPAEDRERRERASARRDRAARTTIRSSRGASAASSRRRGRREQVEPVAEARRGAAPSRAATCGRRRARARAAGRRGVRTARRAARPARSPAAPRAPARRRAAATAPAPAPARGRRARPARAAARGSSRARPHAGTREDCSHLGRGLDDVLEVVEQEQQAPPVDELGQRSAAAERPGGRRTDVRRIGERRKRHPPHTVGIRVRHLAGGVEREPRLPRSAGAGQRQETRVVAASSSPHVGELLLTPEELRRRDREVRPVQRLERRELVVAELVDPLRRAQVLEPVLAEVAQLGGLDERGRRRRNEHLPAVTGGGDPRRAVDVALRRSPPPSASGVPV